MGYYGVSQYRGDYYPVGRYGDYYPVGSYGDPGFFDFVSDVVGGVTSVGKTIMGIAAPVLAKINPAFGAAAQFAPSVPGLLSKALPFLDRPAQVSRILQMGPPAGPSYGAPSQGSFAMAASAPGTGSTSLMIPGPTTFLDRTVGPSLGLFRKQPPMPGGAQVVSAQHGVGPLRRGGVPELLARPRKPMKRHLHTMPDGTIVEGKVIRRMNPLNPRALRRSLGRARGFERFARRVLRFTSPGKHPAGFKPKFGRGQKRRK